MIDQIKITAEVQNSAIQQLASYKLSNGEEEMLYTVNYPEQYKLQIKDFFLSIPIVAIKTPLVDKNIILNRMRPTCFYPQLYKTNEFIDWLGCSTIDLGFFDRRLTYDAVHWTQEGNKFVFEKIISQLA